MNSQNYYDKQIFCHLEIDARGSIPYHSGSCRRTVDLWDQSLLCLNLVGFGYWKICVWLAIWKLYSELAIPHNANCAAWCGYLEPQSLPVQDVARIFTIIFFQRLAVPTNTAKQLLIVRTSTSRRMEFMERLDLFIVFFFKHRVLQHSSR